MLNVKNKAVRPIVIFVLLLAMLLTVPVYAKKDYWYCRHVAEHARPKADPALSYVEKYDAYYIGKDEEDKVIYLTFDAGYENGNVEKILDVLKEKEVPAAFFVLSHLVEKDTALVARMFDEGHLVCNHTARHKDMSLVNDKAVFETELKALEDICREKIGKEMAKYYRPPEGNFSETNLKYAQELGYQTIFWSFAYADWDNQKQMSHETALSKIMDHIHPGEVMLLHPTSSTNAAILGEVIDQCRNMGYRFGTLHELTQTTR